MRVFRYLFDVADQVDLRMYEGARLLMVRAVGPHQVEMWALVDERAVMARRRLRLTGTGHRISASETEHYVGTTVSGDGAGRLVWHVFDLGEVLG
jgi:hypothetical protein